MRCFARVYARPAYMRIAQAAFLKYNLFQIRVCTLGCEVIMIGLILFIVIAVLIAVFTGFNIGNVCDVNVIFHTFHKVPVFITIIVSFVAGIVVALPFSFGKGKSIAAKKIDKIKAKAAKDALKNAESAGGNIPAEDRMTEKK